MFLTITSTADSASDLGYLLHKHPARAQSFEMTAGRAYVFYPEATASRCTAALLLEVDPIALVRSRQGRGGRGGRGGAGADALSLGQYVNDRPYAASSMLAVALGKVFRTAMTGRCDLRPELARTPLPLDLHVPALPSTGGVEQVRRFFEPLGWVVDATPIPLDPTVPGWGDSRYVDLRLTGTQLLSQALSHLYVLLPVLDDAKHYWVGDDEVDKLVRAGSGWLADHPDRDLITRRYLAHQRDLIHTATDRLIEIEDTAPPDPDAGSDLDADLDAGTAVDEPRRRPLAQLRRAAVMAALREAGAARVADLGCGEGALLRDLLADPAFSQVVGADVSPRALALAERRLHLERMPDTQRARLQLLQSSLTYRDERLAGFDAVVLMEVIEHVDVTRLPSVERTVFAHAAPRSVVVTTPNAEHNVRFPDLAHGGPRHSDHRFEWTRAEFAMWADKVADEYGYRVTYRAIGDDDPEVGAPTQLALFTREATVTREPTVAGAHVPAVAS